jgi:hypothetical protein
MHIRSLVAFALAGLASAAIVAEAAPPGGQGGVAKLRPGMGRGKLLPPVVDPPVDPPSNDRARVETRRFPAHKTQPGREWLRFKLRHLEPETGYTLWIVLEDDPLTLDVIEAPYQLGDVVTTNAWGNANRFLDTKKGDVLVLDDVLGKTAEVRDATGTVVVLTGSIPLFRTFK